MMTDGSAAPPPSPVHQLTVRIYFEDTDAFGVVYHASYLRFAERARTEMMRGIGFDHKHLMSENGVAFVVRRCEVDFLAPARIDDLLTVETRATSVKCATIELLQTILRDGREIARLRVLLACMKPEGRAVRIPKAIMAAFAPLVGED